MAQLDLGNVMGPQGVKGDTGTQGIQGVKGDTGAQGIQGPKGDKGDPGVEGKQGVKGNTGAQGIQGKSFVIKGGWISGTAYVNNANSIDVVTYNGSSYACKTSHTASTSILPTNVTYWSMMAQKGDKGEQGIQGPKGAQGIQGIKGDTGNIGAQGIQGIQGPKGDTGKTSPLANNLLTTADGYALDAKQGPVIQEKIDLLNDSLTNVPKCKIHNVYDLPVPHGSDYVVNFTREEFKSHPSMHSDPGGDTSKIIAPVAGTYMILGQLVYEANANGCRQATIRKNGTIKIAYQLLQSVSNSSIVTIIQVSALVYLNVGDYVELIAYQNSGNDLLITGGQYDNYLNVVRVGS